MKLFSKNRSSGKSALWYFLAGDDDTLECAGYTSLAHCPEVIAAVNAIASLLSSMTIHLMEGLV